MSRNPETSRLREQVGADRASGHASEADVAALTDLAERTGLNPLLTHGSAGNCSCKSGGVLWIKASGKWMCQAKEAGFLVGLDLEQVRECMAAGVDPAVKWHGTSIETSMHAVLPQAFVLHVHSVNAIAWAVRRDARDGLGRLLEGLEWRWIEYAASGLPLALAIREASTQAPASRIFVLGNHGLVVAGGNAGEVYDLVVEVERRLSDVARRSHGADYSVLAGIADDRGWKLPGDEAVHALGTDAVARTILAGGTLFPAQVIVQNFRAGETYLAVQAGCAGERGDQALVIVEGVGVLYDPEITVAEEAMLGSLAQVVQRIPAGAPLRYLTKEELEEGLVETAYRYRELANSNRSEVGARG